ncbi:MAG: hypothetical protein Q4E18_15355, partial [Clostridia bacterium]|nr:hypothetical protein [Clostridia bacterium]
VQSPFSTSDGLTSIVTLHYDVFLKKNRRLTTTDDDAIITTGRDDAFAVALPSEGWKAAYQ